MKKFLLSAAAVSLSLCASAQVFLAGGFNGWSSDANEMELKDGVYTLTVESLTTEFKVVDKTIADKTVWLGSTTPLTLGEALELSEGNDNNVKFADDVAVVKNAVVSFVLDTKMLTVTGEVGEAEVTYALHGNFATGEWNSVNMTADDNLWSCSFEALENAAGEFGIKELTAGAQTAWFSCPNGAEYLTISGAAADMLCATSDNTNFKVEGLTGAWTFVFDAEAKTLTVKEGKDDAIENVEAVNNAAAVYYNLNGVRVANPQNGLFFKKQGNVVTKVIVK